MGLYLVEPLHRTDRKRIWQLSQRRYSNHLGNPNRQSRYRKENHQCSQSELPLEKKKARLIAICTAVCSLTVSERRAVTTVTGARNMHLSRTRYPLHERQQHVTAQSSNRTTRRTTSLRARSKTTTTRQTGKTLTMEAVHPLSMRKICSSESIRGQT